MASVLTVPRLTGGTVEIKSSLHRMVANGSERDIAVSFEGLTRDEARMIIAKVIEIEQARGGAEAILSPTEYANRFSGLDFE